MSINLLLEQQDQAVIWRGPLVGRAIQQFWGDVLWGTLDYLIVDLPPGTSDASLTVMQSLLSGGADSRRTFRYGRTAQHRWHAGIDHRAGGEHELLLPDTGSTNCSAQAIPETAAAVGGCWGAGDCPRSPGCAAQADQVCGRGVRTGADRRMHGARSGASAAGAG
jgi:hypothetical protein